MKQIIQNYKTGELKVEEVPSPLLKSNGLLIKTMASLISAGTERTKLETAKMNIIEKAISHLDLLKVVLNNIKQEGVIFTLKKAFNKLDTPISLGYSCAGEVIDIGNGVSEFKIGDRVACVGEIYAAHSQINFVPAEFAISIPLGVNFEEASFVGLGAIALNSVQLAQLRKNEKVTIIGLGLIGQIVAQIVKAKECLVLGIEIDDDKISLARQLGLDVGVNPLIDDVDTIVRDFSRESGVDAVIISAASKNNLPIEMAGKIARNKGRVILIGAMPIIIPRKDYYEKELTFIISRGFGADLYYKEEKNRWYPYNYKPITIKENIQNFLALLAEKKISVDPLISHRFNLSDATKAYRLIENKKEKYLGIIFEYDSQPLRQSKILLSKIEETQPINVGFIGAGSFAQGYLLPILKKMKNVNLMGVATAGGINAKNVVRKFGFKYCTTDYNEILNEEQINCIFIATQHNLHARLAIEALKRNKNIFVEKPLCLNKTELKDIMSVYRSQSSIIASKPLLMIGFNRRFSPFIIKLKDFFSNRISPLVINYRINAGYLESSHWLNDLRKGGGRIIGEVCHFLDLLQFITGAHPVRIFAETTDTTDIQKSQNLIISIKFQDGSLGTINYNAIGDISYPRERIEVFGQSSICIIDNFRRAEFVRNGRTKRISSFNRDMGHKNEIKEFINCVLNNKDTPINFQDIVYATYATFKIIDSLNEGSPINIDLEGLV